MQFQNEEQPDLSLSEEKIYRAVLQSIEPREIRWTPKDGKNAGIEQSKLLLEWWWEVQDEETRNPADGAYRRVKGTCEARLTNHPDNRFRNWAEAILQREVPVGMNLDTDDLTGMRADITIKKVPDRRDPAKLWEEVAEIMPAFDAISQDVPPF